MNNSSQEFYWINRAVPWSCFAPLKVGDTTETGNGFNPYFSFFLNHAEKINVQIENEGQKDFLAVRFLELVRDNLVSCPQLAQVSHRIAAHFVKLIGELLWEQVRKEEFPDLPSRQRCIFLNEDRSRVPYWIERLDCPSRCQVLRIHATGRFHRADERLLIGDGYTLAQAWDRARAYWRGQVQDGLGNEILFEGKITVLEIIA